MNRGDADIEGRTLWFTSYGLRIAVRASEPDLLAHVAVRRPAAWRAASPGRADRVYVLAPDAAGACYVVSAGTLTVGQSTTVEQMLDAMEDDAQCFVAEFARRRVFVHAGTVGIGGRAVVVPGRSGTGKSTLVAALVRRGATYYSDEYAVFDERGRVHAYPKPLSMRAEDGSAVKVDLGPPIAGHLEPLSLGAVLSGSFAGPGTTWQPHSESAGHGMMALVDNAIAVRRQPEQTMTFLQRALSGVVVLVGPRGEAEATAEAVMRRFESCWG
jgi:hypothetical protein